MRFKLMFSVAAAVTAIAVWVAVAAVRGGSDEPASQRKLAELQANLDDLKAELRNRTFAGPRAGTDETGNLASLARREARAEAQRAIDELSASDDTRPAKSPPVTFQQSQELVLEAFEQETSDPSWSADAARKLDAAIREHLPNGSRVASIECHATMCQLKVFCAEPSGAQALLMNALHDWRGSLFVAGDRQDHGENEVTIIAAREGHEPPLGPR